MRTEIANLRTDLVQKLGSGENKLEAFRTDVAKEFGLVRSEIADFKTDVAKEFGSLRTEMRASTESLKTAIESAKLWMLVTGVSAVLLMLFSIVGHALKII